MNNYLDRLKTLKSEKGLHGVLTKPTIPPFVSFGSDPGRHIVEKILTPEPIGVIPRTKENAMPECIWRNPYPQGTPEARAETLRVIEAAKQGEPI